MKDLHVKLLQAPTGKNSCRLKQDRREAELRDASAFL